MGLRLDATTELGHKARPPGLQKGGWPKQISLVKHNTPLNHDVSSQMFLKGVL